MPKEVVTSPDLAKPNGRFAHATVAQAAGRLLFISGMTARNKEGCVTGVGDITSQTHQVCQNLRAAVEGAGGAMDDIARVDVYVRNIADHKAIAEVRAQYFTSEPPASTLVEVSQFVNSDYLIEISAIAVLP